jgi:hypothetical protein
VAIDLLDTGAQWQTAQNKQFRAQAVTYSREDMDGVEVTATVGRSKFRTQDADGMYVSLEYRDYLIEASDIAAFGVPQPGDLIVQTLAGLTHTFVVSGPSGEPVYAYADPGRRVFRIHTIYAGIAT